MRVLITDPDHAYAHTELLGDRLRSDGHVLEKVATGGQALAHLASRGQHDFLLLAMELPDADGVSVCRRIREHSAIPIIGLIRDGLDVDRVLCLQAGADDCLIKPYGVEELLARIDAVNRRARRPPALDRTINYGPLAIDLRSREVWLDGWRVEVTRREFGLLSMLAIHRDQVLPRDRLLAEVWDSPRTGLGDDRGAARTIDTHVSALRRKLGAKEWIVSVRGVGFRLGRVS